MTTTAEQLATVEAEITAIQPRANELLDQLQTTTRAEGRALKASADWQTVERLMSDYGARAPPFKGGFDKLRHRRWVCQPACASSCPRAHISRHALWLTLIILHDKRESVNIMLWSSRDPNSD